MTSTSDFSPTLVAALAQADVARALQEDVAGGDLTAGLVDPTTSARARVLARESALICGEPWVRAAFAQVDSAIDVVWLVPEGQRCAPDQVIFEARGAARSLLTAERTALNFLQLLSAVTSKTDEFV